MPETPVIKRKVGRPLKNKVISVDLPALLPWQEEVFLDEHRFKVLCLGRRAGKTLLACVIAAQCVLEAEYRRVWWVSPNYATTSIAWRLIQDMLKGIYTYKNETDRVLRFPNGSEIWFKSADNYDGLRGESLDLCIFDEAAFVNEKVWPTVIRPTLSDRIGKSVFISTPNGLNWFYDIWLRGQNPDELSWKSWQFPTSANPYIAPEEIEEAKLGSVPEIFEQEYLALFRGDGISVFRNIDERCHIKMADSYQEGTMYVAGLDFAGKQDYTVLSVFDAKRKRQVEILRLKQIDFATQHTKIISCCNRWHVNHVIAEENTIGAQNIEVLEKSGLRITPFLTTQDSKQQAIQNLIYLFEMEAVQLLDDKAQIGELKNFIVTRTANGKFRYAAQRGHDDIVIANMLACSEFSVQKDYPPSKIVQIVPRTAIARKEPKQWTKTEFSLGLLNNDQHWG